MTIADIKLTDKFHVWVAATNLILQEINREIVLEAKQQLKTIDKSTLVAAINELVANKLDKNANIELSDNDIITSTILANTKIQVGSEGKGNSIIEFYDDTTNLYRKIVFNHENQKWYLENTNGILIEILTKESTIDGNEQEILLKRLTDEEFNQYTGPEGSLSYNLVTKAVHIHDGFTAGGNSVSTSGIIVDKVKINQDDGVSGYLNEKIISGEGIQFIETAEGGSGRIVINNLLVEEFTNKIANTYLKRDVNNQLYQFLTTKDVMNDLKVGKIYCFKKSFTNDVLLEDNIYTYTTIINEDTVISINKSMLYYATESLEFEIILDIETISNITFTDNIKWDEGIQPAFENIGKYILRFKTLDGVNWLVKLDSFYSA